MVQDWANDFMPLCPQGARPLPSPPSYVALALMARENTQDGNGHSQAGRKNTGEGESRECQPPSTETCILETVGSHLIDQNLASGQHLAIREAEKYSLYLGAPCAQLKIRGSIPVSATTMQGSLTHAAYCFVLLC